MSFIEFSMDSFEYSFKCVFHDFLSLLLIMEKREWKCDAECNDQSSIVNVDRKMSIVNMGFEKNI